MKFRKARLTDIPQIELLLALTNLHNQDVAKSIDHCIVSILGNEIVGTAALECVGENALLKSFAVHPEHQGKNIGRAMFLQTLPIAYKNNVERLFLLTTTAKFYFSKLNFKIFDRNDVPGAIAETNEFKLLCPASATCMSLVLAEMMHYYPKSSLRLTSAIDGVKLWGVALKNTQFTYFEVEPNKEFEMHSHESEQITYVLEGELYFKSDTETICVKAGEVIAIPSNLRHGAFTKEKALKAVDAWSPINRKYN